MVYVSPPPVRAIKARIICGLLTIILLVSGACDMVALEAKMGETLFVPRNAVVYRVESERALFDAVQIALYAFEDELFIQTPSYQAFLSYWDILNNEFAMHSVFQSDELYIRYIEDEPCTIRMSFDYNKTGRIMQGHSRGDAMVFDDSTTQILYDAALDIVEQATHAEMGPTEKALALHDYLVLNAAYDLTGPAEELLSAESVLFYGRGQCQGFVEAYSLLLALADVDVRAISGTGVDRNNQWVPHAWTLVQVAGAWYHVDVTWNNPIPKRPQYASRTYFMRSDAFMQTTHSWYLGYPSATGDRTFPDLDLTA